MTALPLEASAWLAGFRAGLTEPPTPNPKGPTMTNPEALAAAVAAAFPGLPYGMPAEEAERRVAAALAAATPHLTAEARADGYREGVDWLAKSLTVALRTLPGGALVLLADIVAGAMGLRPDLKEETR